jgi:hypothetical protein
LSPPRQGNSRPAALGGMELSNIVTDLRHHLIFTTINHIREDRVKGEDGIHSLARPPQDWRHGSENICRRNVLTSGSIRTCGDPRMALWRLAASRPCFGQIHWTARSWALAFSLGNSTLAQGNLLVAAFKARPVDPVCSRPLAKPPVYTGRVKKSGSSRSNRIHNPSGDSLRQHSASCRGVVNTWQTRCLLTRLTLRRRV